MGRTEWDCTVRLCTVNGKFLRMAPRAPTLGGQLYWQDPNELLRAESEAIIIRRLSSLRSVALRLRVPVWIALRSAARTAAAPSGVAL